MKFVGTTVIYAYLQAVGVLCSHEQGCFWQIKLSIIIVIYKTFIS